MSELQKAIRKLEGDGPVEKHILLLKLTELLDQVADLSDKPVRLDAGSVERAWLARLGAIMARLGLKYENAFTASKSGLHVYWRNSLDQVQGQILDAIEDLKLELELDGRSEIGSAYATGEVYRFFADLKNIVAQAQSRLMVIDPYFDGASFDAYLAPVPSSVKVMVLFDRNAKDVALYADKHRQQYNGDVELRSSKELYDRVIFVDANAGWIMGGSIKDAGKKPTYLIPLASPMAASKKAIYMEIWDRATNVM